jgi:hypothetical protein
MMFEGFVHGDLYAETPRTSRAMPITSLLATPERLFMDRGEGPPVTNELTIPVHTPPSTIPASKRPSLRKTPEFSRLFDL